MSHRAALVLLAAGILIAATAAPATEAQAQDRTKATPTTTTRIIALSRDSAVEIMAGDKRLGSGFVIAEQHVATSFHVVTVATPTPAGGVTIAYLTDLKIRLPDGEIIEGECVALATDADPAPYRYDFAVVRLRRVPKSRQKPSQIARASDTPSVGDDVFFSGYPLTTPGMVTHKGMVSGTDSSGSLIILQAAINKGNSGGAVLTAAGNVVGIINFREGEISQGLKEVQQKIKKAEEAKDVQTKIRFSGVDPLQSTREIIGTLDRYISTGIGYAISVKFLRTYLETHPDLLKK